MTRQHPINPQYIQEFHRYQCAYCKQWVSYSEEDGRWHHKARA
jgi:hypothetical protein